MKVMWQPENCKQSSRVCFHLHHANFWKYFSTLIPDHGPLNPALQGPVSLCFSKWSWRLSLKRRYQVSFMQQKAHRPTCQELLSPPHYYISLTQGRSMETEFINLTSCDISTHTHTPFILSFFPISYFHLFLFTFCSSPDHLVFSLASVHHGYYLILLMALEGKKIPMTISHFVPLFLPLKL